MLCIINNSIIPGTPNKPAIIAVIGFITRFIPMKPPIRLTINNRIPPITPFAINFKMNLMGKTNNIPIIYNRNNPNTKANTVPILIKPLLLYHILYNRGQVM